MALNRLPDTTHVSELALVVSDLARATRFYTETLGLRALEASPGLARLGAGGAFLQLEERPDATRPRGTTGLFHFAILYPSRADLAGALRRLVDARYPIQGAADHLVSEAVYLADPEGNGIEIYRDRPRAEWPMREREVVMATDPLDVDALLAKAPAGWRTPDAVRLGHVHLQVHDIPAVEAFYRDRLGFDLTARYGRQASFFGAGGYHHHVGVNTWTTAGAPPAPEGSLGLRWFRIATGGERLPAWIQASLESAGLPVREEDGALWTRDPSGHVAVMAV
jgi:catechol 2,3-dioxygenase